MSKKTKIEPIKIQVVGGFVDEMWGITLEDGTFFELTVYDRGDDHNAKYFWDKYGIKFNPTELAMNNEPFNLGMSPNWFEIDFQDEEGEMISITKKPGVGLQLFAAIESWFKDWIKRKNPEGIEFESTGEPSKTKLYKSLAKRIVKLGYIDMSVGDIFWLVRKDFKPWFAAHRKYI